jgi:hypothetical protein
MTRLERALACMIAMVAAAFPIGTAIGEELVKPKQPIQTTNAPKKTAAATKIQPSSQNTGSNRQPGGKEADNAQSIPGVEKLVSMVRNTLITLNDANITNNYAILFQLSSREAQGRATPELLSESFRSIREQGTDMSIISAAAPQFSELPTITPKGLLRLKGTFQSSPTINFDLFFQKEDDQWKIFAIGLGVIPVDSRPVSNSAKSGNRSPG